ncbi:MAG: pitrilysin family protein [Pseudomonadota bacterium]
MALFAELRRRNVLKVALLYVIASWLALWFVQNTGDVLGMPPWAYSATLIALTIGFPIALAFAWMYEITPAGLKKSVDVDQTQSIVYKTGQKLNSAVAVLLVLGALALIGEGLLPKFEFPVFGPPEGDAPTSQSTPPEIRSLVLDNGLKIIVWPDHDIPNVAMYNFVRAGGRNEYPGITGLAHFFEHMMFNGTENHGPGEFDRLMEAAGSENNAFTTPDITVYTNRFPKTALQTVIELEADRLENLAIDPEMVERERGAVQSERRTAIDNNNLQLLFEQLLATAFVAHPYQFPVLGWPSDIASWTQEDLEQFFETYYAPNNCVMVFTGDVTPAEVFSLAVDHFEPISSQEPPAAIRTIEPEQRGVRRVLVEADAQTPMLQLGFHAGSVRDPLNIPLTLLLRILAGDESSRLHQLLVEEQQSAVSVGSLAPNGFDPWLAFFYLILPPDGDPQAVEETILAELSRTAIEGVTEEELTKAKNIMMAEHWRNLATIDGKAAALGNFEVYFGSYEALFAESERIEAVTVEQLKEAATIFRENNMTVGVLQPRRDEP